MQIIRNSGTATEIPELLDEILPIYLTDAVRRSGAPSVEEIRMHAGRYTSVTSGGRSYRTGVVLSVGEIAEILKKLCGGSLYAYGETIRRGYFSLDGGIRVGVCGSAATEDGRVIGVNDVTGLIVRVPHRVPVDGAPLLRLLKADGALRSALLYSPPGVGKTTVLRAVAEAASGSDSLRTAVVDSREELVGTIPGKDLNLDILVGYPRELGIGIAVQSLGAELILCDEIGTSDDARAILCAANCGVPIIATAHASCVEELLRRPALRALHRARVFGFYVGLRRDGGAFRYRVTSWRDAEGSGCSS